MGWPHGRARDGGIDEVALPPTVAGRLWLCGKHVVGPDPDAALARTGASAVVCLNELGELSSRYPGYVEWLRADGAGRRAVWFPIPDLHVPDVDRLRALLADLRARLEAGDGLLVHCGAGIGRAGTVAAALLVSLGLDLDDALARLRASRPGAGPQTAVQEELVTLLAMPPRWTTVTIALPFRAPLWPDSLFGHLVATAVPGVEEWREGAYRRTLRLPHGPGVASLTPGPTEVTCRLALADERDGPEAAARCRRLLDLDADPSVIDAALAADDALAPSVAASPGRRVPGTVDPAELALRAVLGQQVSTRAARTHAARLVLELGEPVDDPDPAGGLTHLFPTAEAVAGVDPQHLRMPASRRRTLVALARALADGSVDLGARVPADAAPTGLAALPGIGPWTLGIVAMRGLADPDAFPVGDLGVRVGASRLGLPTSPAALTARAERWRPWRAYAVQHLWAAVDHEVNALPAAAQAGEAQRSS